MVPTTAEPATARDGVGCMGWGWGGGGRGGGAVGEVWVGAAFEV